MARSRSTRDATPLTTRRGGTDVRRRGQKKGGALRWIGRIFLALALLAIAGVLGVSGLIAYYSQDLPDVASLRELQEPQTTRVVDRDGELLGEIFSERRTVVPLDRVPRALVLSVLAAEDADFYRHRGLDYAGLFRAVVRGLLDGGRFRGTSTITQQVVKNMLLTSERSWERKIRELILARQLEEALGKDEILGLYLNHINFGHGRYGVQEASRYYFGHDVEELTLAEASLLAGIPQSPTHLSPRTHPEAARRRQLFVLAQLEEKREEYWPELSLDEIRRARDARVEIAPVPEARQVAPEAVELARRTLTELVGEEAARRGGYTVETTIDVETQLSARTALQEGLRALDQRQGARAPLRRPRVRRGQTRPAAIEPVAELRIGGTYDAMVTGSDDQAGTLTLDVAGHPAIAQVSDLARWNPDGLAPSEIAEEGARVRASILALSEPAQEEGQPASRARARLELGAQGAVIVIDPRARDVLALIGGYEAEAGFNRATQAERQPGSTFKPIVYGVALRSRRYTPASIVIDAPGVYDQWQPHNFETWEYAGEIRLRSALAHSVNQVAVRVIEDVTAESVVTFARDLGISTALDPSLALALGASEVRPIELANAYATIAAGGRWEEPRIIARITDASGHEVALPRRAEPREVMTPAEAYLLTSMLESVVREGTAQAAQRLGRPCAGKTGTSNDARDTWFAGFTPDLTALVWVGFDDHRELGRRESGARTALPIWMDVMRRATEGRPVVAFPVPPGVVTARIDPRTGLLAYEGQTDAIDELFLEGTVPTEIAREAGVLDPTSFLMEQFGDPPEGSAGDDDGEAPEPGSDGRIGGGTPPP